MEFFGNYFKTFLYICLDHMQSFIKIGGLVSEIKWDMIQRDIHLLLLGFGTTVQSSIFQLLPKLQKSLFYWSG